MLIGQQPVQLRGGQRCAERRSGQIEPVQFFPRLRGGRASAQQPRDELKLRDVRPACLRLRVHGVSDKIQTCHANALFVDRIVVKRIAACHMRHAKNCVMRFSFSHIPERDWKLPRH